MLLYCLKKTAARILSPGTPVPKLLPNPKYIGISVIGINGFPGGIHYTLDIPYRTTLFIGINVRKICDCQNNEKFKPSKTYFQQALVA